MKSSGARKVTHQNTQAKFSAAANILRKHLLANVAFFSIIYFYLCTCISIDPVQKFYLSITRRLPSRQAKFANCSNGVLESGPVRRLASPQKGQNVVQNFVGKLRTGGALQNVGEDLEVVHQ